MIFRSYNLMIIQGAGVGDATKENWILVLNQCG